MNDQHRAGGLDPRTAEQLLDTAAQAAADRSAPGTTPENCAAQRRAAHESATDDLSVIGHAPHDPAADDLSGGSAADEFARLREVLAAAAAPARPEELTGEDAAVAAFLAARPARPVQAAGALGSSRRARSHVRRLAALPRVMVVKILVGVAILVASGGVAVAAGTGHLPGQDPTPAPTHRSPKIGGNGGTSPVPGPSIVPGPLRPPSPTRTPKAKAKKKGDKRSGHEKKPRKPRKPEEPKKPREPTKPEKPVRPPPGYGSEPGEDEPPNYGGPPVDKITPVPSMGRD
ncbi:hypothetical protein [Actinomadura macra]|uniref:hypothetical protein n=1 Tax=Actinomadura macra TaxID=46164 RepID=UPI000836B68E|nr:hypothetical protein [Actinomadura macra]